MDNRELFLFSMELDKVTFDKLKGFIHQARQPNYELEVRLYGKNFKKVDLDYDSFNRVFKKLTFSKENNGMGFSYEIHKILDVIVQSGFNNGEADNTRVSIMSDADIKKYWLMNNFDEIDMKNVNMIEKEKKERIDDPNYNIRFSLNYEKPEKEINKKDKNLILNKNVSKESQKIFRMKNRYSILSDDGLFSFDLTTTKMGRGKIFRDTNTLKEIPTFEIEIEYVGGDSQLSDEEIVTKLVSYTGFVLCTIQNNDYLMKEDVIREVLGGYGELTNAKTGMNSYDFIAASPVSFHRTNLLKSDTTINIFQNYAVTLKADGERHFMYIAKSDNPSIHGHMYLFDTNFRVIEVGRLDTSWSDTLIEGELVKIGTRRIFYMYDILFEKGRDVRRRFLARTGDAEKDKMTPRFDILLYFQSAMRKTQTYAEHFSEENSIQLELKPYKFMMMKKTSDPILIMFKQITELWQNRTSMPYHTDGLIFTPITEFYPNKGGTWNHCLKWKPPHLNTIDFLIRTQKYDNGKDIKTPYLSLIKKADGKIESELHPYKTVKLFVGSYRRNGNRKTPIPVAFNPDNVNAEEATNINICNIMINDMDKMIAIDPFTEEEEFIEDDMVVEFGFDESAEMGYQWKPFRHRRDKTIKYKSGGPIANNEKTATDVYNSIRYPVTENMLLTGKVPITDAGVIDAPKTYFAGINENNTSGRLPYQNFHNHFIKYILYYSTSPAVIEGLSEPKGSVLDLCAGKGVDMNKVAKAQYYKLVGVEYDYHSVKKAQELFKQMSVRPKLGYFIRGDTSKLIFPAQEAGFTEFDKINMRKFLPNKYLFDTVSTMFCIHYFFKDEVAIRSMLQNVNDNLKIGGFLVGTTFDGERIHEALKGKNFIEGKKFDKSMMWKIEKKYKTKLVFDERPMLGKQIDVYVGSIGNVHPEYLVNFKYFEKLMEEYGFEKVFVKPFEEFYNDLKSGNPIEGFDDEELNQNRDTVGKMSEDEKIWSFFSNAFVFRKVKNTPDSLYKKLIALMDKRQKKVDETKDGEKSEISYSVVSPGTEATLVATEEKESSDESSGSSMSGGDSGDEEDLEEISDRISNQIAGKVARKVLLKVASKINGSIKPSEMMPTKEKMATFVPPPTNKHTTHFDDGNKIKEIVIQTAEDEEEDEEEEDGYESDDGMRDF